MFALRCDAELMQLRSSSVVMSESAAEFVTFLCKVKDVRIKSIKSALDITGFLQKYNKQ